MERRVPPVAAVVVTTGDAPRLAEALASLEAQDYPALSVLVLAAGSSERLEATVAAACPGAYVRELDEDRGFGAAANEALSMVEGAAFLCLCHDDVRLRPDAVRLLVEEAFRSNAGIVTPKVVRGDDPSQLLHVGLNADRFGATTERIEPGEVDHGQHDTAREVFVAPGGVQLVRLDLLATLGGFDPDIVVLGEDLDLCWRAQVAGSRVVFCPEAVVEHDELLANGLRPLHAAVSGAGAATLASLTRRHRLWTMLTCYGWLSLPVVVAQLVALEAGECAVAILGRDRVRLEAITGSWRWCFARRRALRERRRALHELRAVDDREVRRLQVGGASRLATFSSRLVHEGVDVARGALASTAGTGIEAPADQTVGFGAAFSDDQSFDELDDLGRREGAAHTRFFAARSTQVTIAVVLLGVFCIAVRNLVATHLPLVGRLAPLDSWWANWRHLFSSWSPAGVGSGSPGSPAFGIFGVAGIFVGGRMGILERVALIGAMPLGAIGVWRLLSGVGSRRARLAGALAYVLCALGPNLVAAGRLDALAALGIVPFVLRRVLRAAGVRPFAEHVPHGHARLLDPAWRTTRRGQLVIAGALEAIVAALDPTAAVAVLAAALGLALGGLAVGERRAFRVLGAGMLSTLVACVLLAPLTISALSAGRGALGVFGAAPAPWSEPGFGGLVRLAVGPFGDGVLSWLLPAAAMLVLFLARDARLASAARFLGMGLVPLLLAFGVARGDLGSFTPDVATLLVPWAVAIAALVGTGVAAFEADVKRARFGWRQLVATCMVLLVVASVIPFVQSAGSGRFDLPPYGVEAEVALGAVPADGGARTLWLGDPRVLPMASWSIVPGLAYATSADGPPGEAQLFAPPGPGPAAQLAHDVVLALEGRTVELGRLLAAAGVANVVVLSADAPQLPGTQSPPQLPPPPGLLASLQRQDDLAESPGASSGVAVFVVTESHGIVAARGRPLAAGATPGEPAAARDWTPALGTFTARGAMGTGTLLAALAPAGDFTATLDGTALPRASAFGWEATWSTPHAGTVVLSRSAPPLDALLAAAVLALWCALLLGALGADRLVRLRAVLRRRTPSTPAEGAG